MQENTTTQSFASYLHEIREAIEETRGELKGRCRIIVHLGTFLFGPPEATVLDRLEAIRSPEELEELGLNTHHSRNLSPTIRNSVRVNYRCPGTGLTVPKSAFAAGSAA